MKFKKFSHSSHTLSIARIGAALLASSLFASVHAQSDNAASGADFPQCLERLQSAAQSSGVSAASFQRFTAGVSPDMGLLEKLNYQPEFKMPIWDYMSALVDDERVQQGQAKMRQHAEVLRRVESAYGVPANVVVAVWGVESNYGQNFGKYPLVQALGTLSCYGRRQSYFRGEFFASLRILQGGHFAPEKLIGSWAGAFGNTQFMPSTFERLAVDFDGDGRKDLIDSVPDALASTANFLKRGGWVSGQPWGLEVRLPAGMDTGGASRTNKQSLSAWSARGVTLVNGKPLDSLGLDMDIRAGLMLLSGAQGPAFLTLRNFDTIYGYNAAESYGLAIAHLSDRLKGAAPFATAWPTDDPGLSRAERRELQTLLSARGYDIGEIDGALGDKSKAAIRQEQTRLGMPSTGRGGMKILQALRAKR